MNITTCELMSGAEAKRRIASGEVNKAFMAELRSTDLTDRQKEQMTISRHDSRSVAAMKRNKIIKAIGRNSLCPCGSGIKFKKCCLTTRVNHH